MHCNQRPAKKLGMQGLFFLLACHTIGLSTTLNPTKRIGWYTVVSLIYDLCRWPHLFKFLKLYSLFEKSNNNNKEAGDGPMFIKITAKSDPICLPNCRLNKFALGR